MIAAAWGAFGRAGMPSIASRLSSRGWGGRGGPAGGRPAAAPVGLGRASELAGARRARAYTHRPAPRRNHYTHAHGLGHQLVTERLVLRPELGVASRRGRELSVELLQRELQV